MTDELLLSAVEESHCLVGALHQQLSALVPVHLRGLFEDKCLEALLASPTRPLPTAGAAGIMATPFRVPMGGRRPLLPGCPAPFTPCMPPPPMHHPLPLASLSLHPPPQMPPQQVPVKVTCEVGCQTFSTGEIRMTQLYYD